MSTLIGIGLYTYQDAARYTGLSLNSIYNFVDNKSQSSIHGLWSSEVGKLGNRNYLSFRDLTELRAISALRNKGFSWYKIREAAEFIMSEFHDSYPLSNGKIRTSNKAKIFHDDKDLISVIGKTKGNYSLKEVLEPLLEELEYDSKNKPVRWFPVPKSRIVVLDPDFSQGKPILREYRIPTDIISHAYKVEKNYELISRLYEVPVSAIKSAVDFESRFAA